MANDGMLPGSTTDGLTDLKHLEPVECVGSASDIRHPPDPVCPRRETEVSPPCLPESTLRDEVIPGEIWRFGRGDAYSARWAYTEKERLACWHFVYEEYLAKGYTDPQELEYRYTLHDALPDTATFWVAVHGAMQGTVTVFPDSPLGLPADELYQQELDMLRRAGGRPVEVGRLVIGPAHRNDLAVLIGLFDALSLYARRLLHATHLVLTVNPSHAKYYERMLLCDRIGEAKSMASVRGAPAVLLTLDTTLEVAMRAHMSDGGPKPEKYRGGRNFYSYLCGRAEEDRRVEQMVRWRRKPEEAFIRRYFVWLRPLIPQLPPNLQNFFFETCYPGYDFTRPEEPSL